MATGKHAAVAAMLLAAASSQRATPIVFYASQSGRSTLDQAEGGGNPFASALIGLIHRPSLTLGELRAELIVLTEEKSRGFQVPDATKTVDEPSWRLKPVPASEKRVALVFVYSTYRDAGVSSLPGAEHDLERVTQALQDAGFEVQSALNPKRNELRAALAELSSRSVGAEAAVVYLTGHGFEQGGRVYLMPGDYPFEEGANRLSELAVDVAKLAGYLKAKDANIVFYGGCRTYW